MKNDFTLAFNEVLEEKGLPQEVVLEALESAMVSAYRRSVNASSAQYVEAKIDLETGKVKIFAEKEIVDVVQDHRTEVTHEEAIKIDPEAEIGGMVIVDSTPGDFGRVAAQTARQVIQQRIREAEREVQYNYYIKQVGEIVSGVVQAINNNGVNIGLELKAEGIMPRKEILPREHFRVHDRVRALLVDVKLQPRGPQILLSRAHRDFLRRLLENEVPEIYHGMVEIRSIAREPGFRSKVAVAALAPGVDPVGACVGIRGVRIQAIVRELNDEKIDVIEWSPDPAIYIAKALSPARVTGVFLDETSKGLKTATVVVPEDQLSLAIGRDGQNARLAAKLTTWRIDIKSLPEATSDVLYKLQKDPEYTPFAEQEAALVPQVEAIMAKKAEGRPVTPEEYQAMTLFVNRVEHGVIQQRQIIKQKYQKRLDAAQAAVPDQAFELPLEVLGLSDRVYKLLQEAEYEIAGDLMLQLEMDRKVIQDINGLGPKAMEEIDTATKALALMIPEPEPEEAPTEPVEEAEPEVEAEAAIEAVEEPEEPEAVEAPEAEVAVEAEAVTGEEVPEEVAAEVTPVEEEMEVEEVAEEEEEEEELPESLEDIFKLKPEMLDLPSFEEQEEELEELAETTTKKVSKKKKPKKQQKYVEIEYDPDQDVTLYRRKRKREEDEWEEDWDV
jgi:N utilization substance protein A